MKRLAVFYWSNPLAQAGLCFGLMLLAGTGALGNDLAADQQEISSRFDRIEMSALRIADDLEAEDPQRAQQIRKTIRQGQTLGVDQRFRRVVSLLEEERLESVANEQKTLAEQLHALYRLLVADPHESRLETERRVWEQIEREVRRMIRSQRSLRARIERESPDELASGQAELREEVAQLRRKELGGAALDEAPSGSSPGGDAPSGHPSPAKQSLDQVLRRAEQAMRNARQSLDKQNSQDAAEQQLRAQHELESARREAQRQLRQLREEEKQHKLARLADRLRALRVEERAILQATRDIDSHRSETPGRAEKIRCMKIAERQASAANETSRTLLLVEEDGTSLIFAETLRQSITDMQRVVTWLRNARTDASTQQTEQGVIDSFTQMLAAVEESLEDLRSAKASGPQQQQPPGEPGLVGKLAELRLLRSSQARIQTQTESWDTALAQGDANRSEARARLQELAHQQRRLAAAAHHMARQADR